MKSQRLLLLLAAVLVLSQVLVAGDLEFEASGSFLSHYMWRGMRLSEGGVFQPSVTVGAKGFSANIWANYQFDPNRWTEVDFTAAYAGEKAKINYEAGYIHYALNEGEDSDEIYGSNDFSLNFKAYAGYVIKNSYMGVNDEGREFSNFYDADFQVSLTMPLGKGFSLEPMIGYSTSLSRNARQAIKNYSISPHGETFYGGATLAFSLE